MTPAVAAPIDPWQPIETAPKGLKLLLTYRNRLDKYRVVLGCYFEEGTLESSHEESGFAPAGWYEATEAYDELSPLDESPTCWCHIPAPPAGDANQQSKTGVTQASDSLARPSDAEIDAAIEGLNPLTGQSEDYIWRPADRARSMLIALRDASSPSPAVRDGLVDLLRDVLRHAMIILREPEAAVKNSAATIIRDAARDAIAEEDRRFGQPNYGHDDEPVRDVTLREAYATLGAAFSRIHCLPRATDTVLANRIAQTRALIEAALSHPSLPDGGKQ